jgi:hypothetical protein
MENMHGAPITFASAGIKPDGSKLGHRNGNDEKVHVYGCEAPLLPAVLPCRERQPRVISLS